jgi:hypothetical protein
LTDRADAKLAAKRRTSASCAKSSLLVMASATGHDPDIAMPLYAE